MEFKIRSTSRDSAEVAEVPLAETGTTRRALRAEIVQKVGRDVWDNWGLLSP